MASSSTSSLVSNLPDRLVCDFFPVASDIDTLAVPGVGDVKGIVLCHPEPVLFAFLTEVALNDEMASTFQEDAEACSNDFAQTEWLRAGDKSCR